MIFQNFPMTSHLAFTLIGSSEAKGQLTPRAVRLRQEQFRDRAGQPDSSIRIQQDKSPCSLKQ